VLRRVGATLGFGTISTVALDDSAVTFAKLANIPTSSILGRATSGTGNVESLSGAQVRSIAGSPARVNETQQIVVNSSTSSFGRLAVKQSANGTYAGEGITILNAAATVAWTSIVDTSGHLYLGALGNSRGYFDMNTGSYTAVSDRSLKADIEALPMAWDQVRSLRPVSYRMKSDTAQARVLGFVAQEVEAIVPEAVSAPQEGGAQTHYMIDKAAIIPVLTKALQEAIDRIEALEALHD
jgi:hypothetical protein